MSPPVTLTWSQSFEFLLVLKASLLLGLGFAASFFLGKASASARHAVWVLTLLSLLVLPAPAWLSFSGDEWRIAVALFPADSAPALAASPDGAKSAALARSRIAAPEARPPDGRRISSTNPVNLFWLVWLVWLLWLLGSALLALRIAVGIVWSCRTARQAVDIADR